jgi:RES domain-containing protein
MLRRDALVAAVQRLPTQPLEGVAFRLILARYAATALSSIGALRTGGRYNVRGRFEALYLASSPVTALREVEALVETADGLRGVQGPPRILLSVDYRLQAVVDLTNAAAHEVLGTTLTCPEVVRLAGGASSTLPPRSDLIPRASCGRAARSG